MPGTKNPTPSPREHEHHAGDAGIPDHDDPGKCNKCGHGFEGPARHVAIQSSDRGVIGWVVDSGDAFAGVKCPNCGSQLIGA
jgi:DNA-directed RNA polymerase subunit RPC12/RpoP